MFINTTKHFPELTMVGLLKYFKPKQCDKDNDVGENPMGLPDPYGDLSKVVLYPFIEVTNVVVRQALEKECGPCSPTFH